MRADIDTAVIMAGGMGVRLRPYTTVLPKPLMPLGDRPLLDVLIHQLANAGVRKIILSVNHLAHIVRAVLDGVTTEDVTLDYHYEDSPLGTCGALTGMRAQLPGRFLVVNGDLLSDYPIRQLMEKHCRSSAALTLGTRIREECGRFGVIKRDAEGNVVDYLEKPTQQQELSIGLYALERRCVDTFLASEARTDMPDLIRLLLQDHQQVQAAPADCLWVDIGNPEEYLHAQEIFETNPERFFP